MKMKARTTVTAMATVAVVGAAVLIAPSAYEYPNNGRHEMRRVITLVVCCVVAMAASVAPAQAAGPVEYIILG
jgi:cytochrome bd-type quinol oxidase subunit 1